MILELFAQTPIPDPNDFENPYAWIALVLVIAVGLIGGKYDKAKSELAEAEKKGKEEWKGKADTCSTDLGKTSDALRLANDAILKLAEQVSHLERAQSELGVKLDRNWTRMEGFAGRLDGLQDAIAELLGRPHTSSRRRET